MLTKFPVGRGFGLVSYIMLWFSRLLVLQRETNKKCHVKCYTALNLLRPCTAALTKANSFLWSYSQLLNHNHFTKTEIPKPQSPVSHDNRYRPKGCLYGISR